AVKGNAYFAGVSSGMVGSNYTQELKDRGLRTPGDLLKLWDFSGSVGGPIKKDRVWYFFNAREEGSYRAVPGMYANLNAGILGKYTYVADLSRPAATAGSWRIANLRLTVQPSTRNKFNLFWDEQHPRSGGPSRRTASGTSSTRGKKGVIVRFQACTPISTPASSASTPTSPI